MTNQKKEVKVEFAPGAFDDFDGSQEELDNLQAEILSMFSNLTPEELEARSQPVDFEEMIENGEIAEVEKIIQALGNRDVPRKLQ
jgi:hypothetical protein